MDCHLCWECFVVVELPSFVQLFATPWIAARQASLSFTNSWSLLKLMTIELVMPSNHLILCCPFLLLPSIFPSSRSFPLSQFFISGGQSTGTSASAQSFWWILRVDFLYDWLAWSRCCPRDSQESSPTPHIHINGLKREKQNENSTVWTQLCKQANNIKKTEDIFARLD